MKKIKNICIISGSYPTEKLPKYTFVRQLVNKFADEGLNCTVISPQSITRSIVHNHEKFPEVTIDTTPGGNKVKVVRPFYISFSSKKICGMNTADLTLKAFMRTCLKAFSMEKTKFDAVYGHFIFPSAITASKLAEIHNIPAFLAYGENTTYTIDYLGVEKTKKLLSNIKGVISVSSENKDVLMSFDMFPENIIEVFPNGVDHTLFYQRDRARMREKFRFPQDKFIIAFVGGFTRIKGADRLSVAISELNDERIKSIFIGTGEIGPSCEGILLKGPQPHNIIPEFLSAADVFVLPTLAEGCCNAIIEAMACGLPVVSSNLTFNDDILDDICSIRIDTSNTGEIKDAIEILLNDEEKRGKLAEGALKKADSLDVEKRARNIIRFMESKMT